MGYTQQSDYRPVDVCMEVNDSSLRQSVKYPRMYCKDHPDEELSYFCFDCLTDCICSECIIHGVHKNHEVQTIRKAYPIIRGRVNF